MNALQNHADLSGGAAFARAADNSQQQELVSLIERHTGVDGSRAAAIPGLNLHRLSQPSPPVHGMQQPTFCLVAQGGKTALLGEEAHFHDSSRYLLISVDLPITAQVVEATPAVPYLGLCLDITPYQIAALLLEIDGLESAPKQTVRMPAPALSVSRTDAPLLDAALRLLRLLDSPRDIPVLAPLAQREILYRLLTGEQGHRLRQAARKDSPTQCVARAIDWLKSNYSEPLRVETMALESCMSVSSLHHHFKAVTSLSPLQYQKHLRLQEARRLMRYENLDAATAGYRVGYASATQFSREYARLFGAPPRRDTTGRQGALPPAAQSR